MAVKRVRMKDVRIRCADDYWDGPLSGVAEVGGKRLYFDVIGEDIRRRRRWFLFGEYVFTRIREFCFYDLPPAEWAVVDECHSDFVKYVGDHFYYDDRGRRTGSVKPSETHHLFYDKWKDCSRHKMEQAWMVARATEVCRWT